MPNGHDGNVQPAIDVEEHDHANKARRVAIVSGGSSGGLTDIELRATPVPVSGTVTASQGTAAASSGKWPVKIINSDDTDNSLSSGGQIGQKVMVVGDGDKYVRGVVAHDASASGVEPVVGGGVASAAAPTSVSADGDAVSAWLLRNGAQATVLTAAGALIGGDAANGVDVDVTRLPALVAGTNLIGDVAIQPRTTGGWDTANFTAGDGSTALTSTAQVIKASAGTLGGWYIFNPNTVTAWVILYNTAAASVTVGTTNPKMVLGVPAGAAANIELTVGIPFSNAGWSIAAVMTTAGGNTAPTTALDVMIFYK